MEKNKKSEDYILAGMFLMAIVGVVLPIIMVINDNEKLASDIMVTMSIWMVIFSIKPIHNGINKLFQGRKFISSAWSIIVIIFLSLLIILALTTVGLYTSFDLSPTLENYITFIFLMISVFL